MNDKSYDIQFHAQTDIGKRRERNQDQVICCPEYVFSQYATVWADCPAVAIPPK